jgi:hypothetical protein
MISDRALHDLWAVFNAKRRKGSTILKVDADSLGAILTTHHTLYSQLSVAGKLAITLGPITRAWWAISPPATSQTWRRPSPSAALSSLATPPPPSNRNREIKLCRFVPSPSVRAARLSRARLFAFSRRSKRWSTATPSGESSGNVARHPTKGRALVVPRHVPARGPSSHRYSRRPP